MIWKGEMMKLSKALRKNKKFNFQEFRYGKKKKGISEDTKFGIGLLTMEMIFVCLVLFKCLMNF